MKPMPVVKPPATVTAALSAVQKHFRKPFTRDALTDDGYPYTSFESLWGRLQPMLAEYGFTVLQQHGEITRVEPWGVVTVTTLIFHESIDGGTKPWHVAKSQMPVAFTTNSEQDLAAIAKAVAAGKRLSLMTLFGLTQKPAKGPVVVMGPHVERSPADWTPDEQHAVAAALEPLSPKQRATLTRGQTSPHEIILAANLLSHRR